MADFAFALEYKNFLIGFTIGLSGARQEGEDSYERTHRRSLRTFSEGNSCAQVHHESLRPERICHFDGI